VEKDEETGRETISAHNRDHRVGTPQGGVISPLLANLYTRRFIVAWKKFGYEEKFGGRIVNYADDMVICREGDATKALEVMKELMGRLKLTVNEQKTRVRHPPEDEFVFLGYVFRKAFSFKKRKWYIGTMPAAKSIKKIMDRIHDQTAKNFGWMETRDIVKSLNRTLMGWTNSFSIGAVSRIYSKLARYTVGRSRQWMGRKRERATKNYKSLPDTKWRSESGPLNIFARIPSYSRAKS
jgi:hypothetical protein